MRSIVFNVMFRALAEKNQEGYSFVLPNEVIEVLKLAPDHKLYLDIQDNRRSIRDVFLLLEDGTVFLPTSTLLDGEEHKPILVSLHRLIRREERRANA